MAVTVDATSAAVIVSASGTTGTLTNITVTASATSLLVWLTWATLVSAPVVTWDSGGSPQTMTQLTFFGLAGDQTGALYGLVNPHAGALTLSVSWTTTTFCTMFAQSYAGTVTSSAAACFTGAQTNNATSTGGTIAVASAVGSLTAAQFQGHTSIPTSLTATSSTQLFSDASHDNVIGARAPGAASVTWTGAIPSSPWILMGVNIAAFTTPILAWPRPIVSIFR